MPNQAFCCLYASIWKHTYSGDKDLLAAPRKVGCWKDYFQPRKIQQTPNMQSFGGVLWFNHRQQLNAKEPWTYHTPHPISLKDGEGNQGKKDKPHGFIWERFNNLTKIK